MSEPSPASKFIESLLVGTVEAIARAGAKAVESLAGDARKALQNQSFKAEVLEKGVEAWRKARVGEIDDLPGSLRDDESTVTATSQATKTVVEEKAKAP
jgi:hypothetical protein